MNLLRPFGIFLPVSVRRRLSRSRDRLARLTGSTAERYPAKSAPSAENQHERSVGISSPASRRPTPAAAAKKSRATRRTRKHASKGSNDDPSTFTGSELAAYLGVSNATISNRRRDRKVYGYSVNQRTIAYPKAQILQGAQKRPPRIIPGVEAVLGHFKGTDPAWVWLTTEQAAVGTRTRTMTTPLDELRRGRIKAVLAQLPTQETPAM